MTLRERIGRWLWPEGVRAEGDLRALRSNISDVWWWCVSDEAALTAAWLRNNDRYRWMTTAQLTAETEARLWPRSPLRGRVGELRDWMGKLTPEAAAEAIAAERDRLCGRSPHPLSGRPYAEDGPPASSLGPHK